MEYREFTAKTVQEAITEATVSFGVTSSEIVYEVIEKGSAGLFGIGSKDAVIRAAIRVEEEEPVVEKVVEEPAPAPVVVEKKEERIVPVQKETAKKVEAPTFEEKERVIVPANKEEVISSAKKFLSDLFSAMQLEVEMNFEFDEKENFLNIDLQGPEMGIIIGKRGQTLDSVQYLTNLAVNRNSESYVRVKIDTEDYRRRRKDTLENLAHNVAHKVKRSHRAEKLEPMNPYERRVIHAALANLEYVDTHSEGEEPYRYVVVTPKR